jgi:hypothetical protein
MDLSKVVKRKEKKTKETRTTCKLTQKGCEDMNYLMKSFNLTHKEIFRCILDDEEFFKMIMRLAKKEHIDSSDYDIRKTFVILSEDLEIINKAVKNEGINRNVLIDCGISCLAPLLKKHRDDVLKNYQTALNSLKDMWKAMDGLEEKLRKLLGEDDYFLRQYEMVTICQSNVVDDLEEEIQRLTAEKNKTEGE